MTVSRRQAREWAIQMLVAADLNPPTDVPTFIANFWEQSSTLEEEEGRVGKISDKIRAFTEERVIGVLAELANIDGILISMLQNWDLCRLGTVERAVLRMGIWEIKNSDVPTPVVINESVDLANWFSTPKSRQLVNGILDHYAKSRA